MKYGKALGLVVAATAALLAFVGATSASASVLCSAAEVPCAPGNTWPIGTILDTSLKTVTASAELTDTAGEPIDTCTFITEKEKLASDTYHGTNLKFTTEKFLWEKCTFPTKTLVIGGDEVIYTGSGNGTVQATGSFEVTINTVFFGSCIYGVTAGTTLGTLTQGKPATYDINAVFEKFSGSNLACPSTTKLVATLALTEPSTFLYTSKR